MAVIPLHGEVNASANIIPFVARDQRIPVAIPTSVKPNDIEAMIVSGPSLSDYGINDGDILIFNKNIRDVNSVMFRKICIVHILSTNEFVAKRLEYVGDGKIRLKASGGGVKDMIFPMEDIKITGVCIAYQVSLREV